MDFCTYCRSKNDHLSACPAFGGIMDTQKKVIFDQGFQEGRNDKYRTSDNPVHKLGWTFGVRVGENAQQIPWITYFGDGKTHFSYNSKPRRFTQDEFKRYIPQSFTVGSDGVVH